MDFGTQQQVIEFARAYHDWMAANSLGIPDRVAAAALRLGLIQDVAGIVIVPHGLLDAAERRGREGDSDQPLWRQTEAYAMLVASLRRKQ